MLSAELLHNCLLELLGTLVLILLGDGVVACVSLNQSKGKDAGWIVVTIAWGLAVMAGVFVAHDSGAHLNPAVSIGLATAGMFPWAHVLPYAVSQLIGGFLGAVLVYIYYKDHFDVTDSPTTKLGIFCTIPAIEGHKMRNLFCEFMGTLLLVFLIICLAPAHYGGEAVNTGGVSAFPVTWVIVAIGMSLGGTTGYAINPVRDFGPRLAHAILPIKGKGCSQWSYSWVPVVGPIAGGIAAAALALLCL